MEKSNKPLLAGRRNYWLMKKWMRDTIAQAREEGIIEAPAEKKYQWKCPITGIVHFSDKPFPEKKEEPKCESRWKRIEIMSGGGSWIAKDDKAEAGAWGRATEPFDFNAKEAAKERGICIQSVSGHSLVMEDYDDKEVLPPWNTETYDGSISPIIDFNDEKTYPKIYGFRTPDKHSIGQIKEGEWQPKNDSKTQP